MFRINALVGGKAALFLAWSAAVVISFWVIFDLYALFYRPAVVARIESSSVAPQDIAGKIANRHLMGSYGDSSHFEAGERADRFALQAVVTGVAGAPGWAMISVDGGAQTGFVEGGEVVPGIRLAQVAADHVVLEGGGSQRELRFAANRATTPVAPPGSDAGAEVASNAADSTQTGKE